MKHPLSRPQLISRNKICAAVSASLLLISVSVGSEDKTPSDNQDLLNQQSFLVGALDTSVVLGLVPIGAVSRPAEILEIGTNLGLKAIAPALTIPNDHSVSPNTDFSGDNQTTGENCYRDFTLPEGFEKDGSTYRYNYSNWFGFWDVIKLPNSNEWADFGALSTTPDIKHANTSAILSMNLFGDMNPDDNIITLPEGRYQIDWSATTQISAFWDVVLPVALALPNLNSEVKYGEAAAKKASKQSATKATKAWEFATELGLNFAEAVGINGVELGTEVSGADLGIFTDSAPTVSNSASQTLTVWDVHTPEISTTNNAFVAEARNFGGSFFSRVEDDLVNTLSYSDPCGKTVFVNNDAPNFLSIGETYTITWTVSDSGVYHPDIASTSFVQQQVTVEDTQGPILVPPAGFAMYSASPIDTSSEEFTLGSPLVADLADPNPVVSNDLPATLEVDRRYIVNYTATDATGNITQATEEDPAAFSQIITVKTPDTNTTPTAEGKTSSTITSEPVSIELTGVDFDIIDGIPDPLAFQIVERPENGEFVAPLLPYFIEDFRLQPDEVISNDITVETLSCPVEPENAQQLEAKLGLLERTDHKLFIEKCYCNASGDNAIPDSFVYWPQYIYIDDDEVLYVTDFEWFCDGGGNVGQTRKRIAKFLDDELLAEFVSSAAPDDIFQVDDDQNIWYNDIVGAGSSTRLVIKGLDSDLNTISDDPGSSEYTSSTLTSDDDGLEFDSRNLVRTHVDREREVIYVNDKSRIYMFDYHDPLRYLGAVRGGETFLRDTCGDFAGTRKGFWMDTDSEGNLYQICETHVHKIGAPPLVDGVRQVGEYIGWMGLCSANKVDPETNVPYNFCDEESQTSKGFQCSDDTCERPASEQDWDGNNPGQFRALRHLDVGPDDILYMVDTGNDRIQRFSPDGTFAGQAISTGDGITEDGSFVLGNMGSPQHVSVNSTQFHVLEGDNANADFFLHIFKTLPFYDITNDSAKVDYVSDLNFQGTDTFSYLVDDGIDVSDFAMVSVEVSRAFRAPENLSVSCFNDSDFTVVNASCEVNEDSVMYLRLAAEDKDGFIGFGGLDELTINIIEGVENGDLVLLDVQADHTDYRYAPDADYFGSDSLLFTADDGVDTADQPFSFDFEVMPVNDAVNLAFSTENDEDVLVVGRGFSRPLIFEFNDPDGTASVSNETLSVDFGDGTLSLREQDWEDIGVYEEDGTPVPPQKNTLPGEGLVVAARAFDQNSPGVEVCIFDETANTSDSPEELVCAASPEVFARDVTLVTVQENPDTDQDAEAASDHPLSLLVTNQAPETWAGLTAENTQLQFALPSGVSMNELDNRCTLTTSVSCDLGDLSVGQELQIDFVLEFDPQTAQDQEIFAIEIISTDAGPRLETSTTSDIMITMADNDEDEVINYFDAFPDNPIYAVDTDSDGLPDEWEEIYGFDPNSPDNAGIDNDGDGASNLSEFLAGTEPFIADAAIISTQISGGNTQFDADANDNLGVAVASGDFNGDGHIDLVALAPNASLTAADTTTGYALVTFGNESGLSDNSTVLKADDYFLLNQLATGDINDDGFDDIVINSYRRVYVFLGLADGFLAPFQINELQQENIFGTALAIEDVDADGTLDLLIGSTSYQDTDGLLSGAVHVYLGRDRYFISGDPQPSVSLSTDEDALLGNSIGVADLDGSGQVDIAVGGAYAGAGRVALYYGENIDWEALPAAESIKPDVTILGEVDFDYFGYSLSTGQDVDNDGVSDLVIGAYEHISRGAVYLYQSSDNYTASANPVASNILFGTQMDENFGLAVLLLPELAFSEAPGLLVGSNQYIVENEDGEINHGRVSLMSGQSLATPFAQWTGEAGSMFGYSLASLGDINSDNAPDFAVGAPALRYSDAARGDFEGGDGDVRIYLAGLTAQQQDSDSDNIADNLDNCPSTANTNQSDIDGDGIGDVCDTLNDPDSDGDGFPDSEDVFPDDPTEWLDFDNDGIGNNADTDDDDDGVADTSDAFPFNANESVDTDGDGIGNNEDTDDDGDGVLDTNDAFPLDPSRSENPTAPTPTPPDSSGGSGGGGGSTQTVAIGMLLIIALVRRTIKRSGFTTTE